MIATMGTVTELPPPRPHKAIDAANERRLKMLDSIKTSVNTRQRPPSNTELAAEFKVSRRTVQTDLLCLKEAGLITIDPRVARGLRVVEQS